MPCLQEHEVLSSQLSCIIMRNSLLSCIVVVSSRLSYGVVRNSRFSYMEALRYTGKRMTAKQSLKYGFGIAIHREEGVAGQGQQGGRPPQAY